MIPGEMPCLLSLCSCLERERSQGWWQVGRFQGSDGDSEAMVFSAHSDHPHPVCSLESPPYQGLRSVYHYQAFTVFRQSLRYFFFLSFFLFTLLPICLSEQRSRNGQGMSHLRYNPLFETFQLSLRSGPRTEAVLTRGSNDLLLQVASGAPSV